MKNENQKSFNVRLNLKKPIHKKAWEKLQRRSASYAETIAQAIAGDDDLLSSIRREIKETMRQELRETLRQELKGLQLQPMLTAPAPEAGEHAPLSEKSIGAAADFLASLM
ncbi:MAG: hypothetical protein Q4C54_09925 [Clostridia bacterium]|nr:hypothetical protein [Clostridia bacterium]